MVAGEVSRVDEPTPMTPVGIICGAGGLPFAVADAVLRQGRPVVLFAINGWAEPANVARYPHEWVALGQFGRLRRLARAKACRDMVFIGTLVRPALGEIRLDLATMRLLPRIVSLMRGGDDHLLSGLGRIFEDHGFRLLGAHEVAPDILAPEGALTRRQPSERDQADIARGLALLRAIGPFDIGQAAVIADNHVLAVEAAEGTDAMLARIADLRAQGRVRSPAGTGVLVKAPKPKQDRRFDLPTIGAQTVDGVARAGLAGLAVVAGGTIMAAPDLMAAAADKAGLFVAGVRDEASA